MTIYCGAWLRLTPGSCAPNYAARALPDRLRPARPGCRAGGGYQGDDHVQQAAIEQQLKTIARLGAFDVFVDALDETVCQQIGTYVERRRALPTDASGFLDPAMASVLALAGVDAFRDRIPALGSKFAQLYPTQQATVIQRRPSAYFTDFLAPILASAGGWRIAESLTAMTVIPCARLIQPEQLNGILTAWAENAQCRRGVRDDSNRGHLLDARHSAPVSSGMDSIRQAGARACDRSAVVPVRGAGCRDRLQGGHHRLVGACALGDPRTAAGA